MHGIKVPNNLKILLKFDLRKGDEKNYNMYEMLYYTKNETGRNF